MRLIDADALLEELKNTYVPVSVKLIDLITNAPAIAQGEPKGYMWPEVESISLYKDEFFTVPLYTSPPQPQVVKDALEKAARICEKMQKDENNTHIGERCSYGTCQIQGSTFAKAIRALKHTS